MRPAFLKNDIFFYLFAQRNIFHDTQPPSLLSYISRLVLLDNDVFFQVFYLIFIFLGKFFLICNWLSWKLGRRLALSCLAFLLEKTYKLFMYFLKRLGKLWHIDDRRFLIIVCRCPCIDTSKKFPWPTPSKYKLAN